MTLLAIDPGTTESAYVIRDERGPVEFETIGNEQLLGRIEQAPKSSTRWLHLTAFVIEMPAVAMYVGNEVFHTCRWVGMFQHAWHMAWRKEWCKERSGDAHLITRHNVKMHLLGRVSHLGRGADAAVRSALLKLYGVTGNRPPKGHVLHGMSGDCWAALAVAETYLGAKELRGPSDKAKRLQDDEILWLTGKAQQDGVP